MLFDPSEWARLAKLAGMEYVVFTAKHHDGFRMFDTALSDFKITNTPYGRDITALVAEAFRREGILVGLYYSPGDFCYQYETGLRTSHIYEPDFAAVAPFGPLKRTFLEYEQGQVEELLTKYGDVFMLWFDGKCEPLKEHAWRVKAPAGARFTLNSVRTTPETKVSVLSQVGGCEWTEDAGGLHITVARLQTIQFVKTPAGVGAKSGRKPSSFAWGPDWPVAVKITNVRPAEKL